MTGGTAVGDPQFVPEWAPFPPTTCAACGHRLLDLAAHCPTCHTQLVAPNVAVASRQDEQEALVARVSGAFVARDASSAARLVQFGDAMRTSVAVVNVSVSFAIDFVTEDKPLYAGYSKLVKGSVRRPAEGEADRHRTAVESMLFGSYGEEIRYAALTMDGVGLLSYGPIAMILREAAIGHRASLLEENSYAFVERNKLRPGQPIPLGYRAPWITRHQLAMAKHASAIDGNTPRSSDCSLVLRNGGNRSEDEFIEVYIYGPFNRGAVERIVAPKNPPNGVSKTQLRMLRAKAKQGDLPMEEV